MKEEKLKWKLNVMPCFAMRVHLRRAKLLTRRLMNPLQGRSNHSCAPVKQLRKLPASSTRDKDRLIPLIAETLREGGSVLVFCGGRAQSQSGAGLVVDMLKGSEELQVLEDVQNGRRILVQQLQSSLGQASNARLENMILSGKLPCMLI